MRWQVLRDLTGAPPEAVTAARALVAVEGWGARILALRGDDGQWAGGACFPADFRGDFSEGQSWTSTLPTLTLLRDLGVDPDAPEMRETIALVGENCRWEHEGQRFFDGEVEPCINGRTVAVGAYFGVDVEAVFARLISEQLEDGGWNCEAESGSVQSSFHSTICVLEGLLEYEGATGGSATAGVARRRGEEYLLGRRLFRRLTTGEVIDPDWLGFSFPTWWHYDVLRALDYFRAAGDPPDPRLGDALAVLHSKDQPDGTWLLENTHDGPVLFNMEDGDGRAGRWNTLRALRIVQWYGRDAASDIGVPPTERCGDPVTACERRRVR